MELFNWKMGVAATTYEPYKSDVVEINGEFCSLLSGVSDELTPLVDTSGYFKKQHVSEYTVLDGDVSSYYTAIASYDIIGLNSIGLDDKINQTPDSIEVSGFGEFTYYGGDVDSSSYVNTWRTGGDGIALRVPKGSFSSEAEAKEGMIGKKFIYEMAEVVDHPIQSISLNSYDNGDIIMTSQSGLIPEFKFKTPLNQGQVLESTMSTVDMLDNRTKGLDSVMQTIKLSNDSPVKSVELDGYANPVLEFEGATRTNLKPTNAWVGESVVDGYLVFDSPNKTYTIDCANLKTGSEYTAIFFIDEYTLNGSGLAYTQTDTPPFTQSLAYVTDIGVHKKLVTTELDLTGDEWRISQSGTSTTGSAKVKVMLLEGDWTNEDVIYFHGTQYASDILIERSGENLFSARWNDEKSTSINYKLHHIVSNSIRATSEPFHG